VNATYDVTGFRVQSSMTFSMTDTLFCFEEKFGQVFAVFLLVCKMCNTARAVDLDLNFSLQCHKKDFPALYLTR